MARGGKRGRSRLVAPNERIAHPKVQIAGSQSPSNQIAPLEEELVIQSNEIVTRVEEQAFT